MAQLDRDNAFFDYKAPTPTIDESDAAEKRRTKAMSQANAASRPATFLEQVENQIAKTKARISTLENTQAELDAINPIPKAGTFLRWDYQGNTQTTGTLRRAVIADGKGGEKIDFNSTEKNPDYVSGSRGGNTSNNNNSNNGNNGNNGNNNTNNNASNNITLVSTETDEYGNVIGIYSDGTQKTLIASGRKYKSTVDENAYAILKSTFADYGLDDPDLLKEIEGYMERGLGSEQAGLELRKTKAYITRFAGNETRRAAGLNVLSEAAYLELENSYKETLRAYGQQGFFGTDRKVAQAKMADIIGNDISATEFKDRVDTVVTRVNNSEPSIKSTLKAFYNIGDEDLIAYFLSPKENLPKLQEKVTSAEIGSEALKQNLITDVASASALARMGITKAQAKEGYETISEVLPTASKLGQIYGEEKINYTQGTAEEEVFAQLESAKRKRLRLAEKEVGSFSGTSGLGRNALGSGKSSAF
jgi:hypothetical protein